MSTHASATPDNALTPLSDVPSAGAADDAGHPRRGGHRPAPARQRSEPRGKETKTNEQPEVAHVAQWHRPPAETPGAHEVGDAATPTEPERFPAALLGRPMQERKAFFKDFRVRHPTLARAHEALIDAIREPGSAQMILMFGPAGVGKTTLLEGVTRQVLQELYAELEVDRGRIPLVVVPAQAEGTAFNWKAFYGDCLEQLNEVLIDRKVAFDGSEPLAKRRTRPHHAFDPQFAAPELRRALIKALQHRRTMAVIVDEAHHIGRVAGGRSLEQQLDCLKSLAELAHTTFVLAGTYDLMSFRDLSGELSRRSIEIPFPRYHRNVPDEVNAFRSLLWAFQRALPVAREPDLLPQWEWLFERSVGMAGPLKDWLVRALGLALQSAATTVTEQHLQRTAPTLDQALSLSRGLDTVERDLYASQAKLTLLRTQLLAPDPPDRQAPTSAGSRPHNPTAGGTAELGASVGARPRMPALDALPLTTLADAAAQSQRKGGQTQRTASQAAASATSRSTGLRRRSRPGERAPHRDRIGRLGSENGSNGGAA